MRERRVQAVLLRQKLGKVFVVVLHFELREAGVSFGATTTTKKWKKRGERKPPTVIEKEVVQLCNYGVPRILRADDALHVANGRFCDGLLRYFASLWFPPSLLAVSRQQRRLVGNGRTKAVRDAKE